MLQLIRSKVSSIFIKALFGVLVVSFAIWGIGDIFLGSPGGRAAVTVGDVSYNSAEVLDRFDRTRRAMRLPPRYDEALRGEILDNVIESMVEAGLFEAESRALGLTVSDGQLKSWIASAPAFQDETGRFSPEAFRRALFDARMGEGEFFASLRGDLVRAQIAGAVAGAAAPPDVLAETLFAHREERRVVRAVAIPAASIPNPGEPDSAQLRAHYEETRADYMAPEYRGGVYVALEPDELAREILVPEADLRAEYEARLDGFTEPARRDLEQYIFADEAAARAAADGLSGPLGADAAADSLARAAGSAGVALEGVVAADLSGEAERAAAFDTPPGRASAPVETPFGWKVFLVRSATEERVRSFEDARAEVRLDLARDKALDAMFELANAFEDALAGGASIEEAAREIDVSPRRVDAVDAHGLGMDGVPVEGPPAGRRFLAALFDTERGLQSDLVETEDGGYVLMRVDRAVEARQRDLHEVEAAVRADWRAERRLDLAGERALRLAEASRGGVGLEAAAGREGLAVARVGPFARSGEGVGAGGWPDDLAAVAFDLSRGDIGVAESGTVVAVAELVEIRPAARGGNDGAWTRLVEGLSAGMAQDYAEAYLASLRARHSASIDRGYIDSLMADSQ